MDVLKLKYEEAIGTLGVRGCQWEREEAAEKTGSERKVS